jgi:hypothetical protein
MNLNKPQDLNKMDSDAAIKYALEILKQLPKGSDLEKEAHITAVLIVFWGALWGTYGTKYAKGFIESQLKSMPDDSKSTAH